MGINIRQGNPDYVSDRVPSLVDHGPVTPEQQAILDTIKEGDLLLLTHKQPPPITTPATPAIPEGTNTEGSNTGGSNPKEQPSVAEVQAGPKRRRRSPRGRQVSLVTSIDPDGTIHLWDPEFSLNNNPGTWSVSGERCYYTPFSERDLCPEEDEDLKFEPLQPLYDHDIIHVNPSGLEMIKLYWGHCPYQNCRNHMFCPGCGGVSTDFPELFMSCGVELSCPTCMGYAFVFEDKLQLQHQYDLESYGYEDDFQEAIKHRCKRIDARRAELGYSKLKWVD